MIPIIHVAWPHGLPLMDTEGSVSFMELNLKYIRILKNIFFNLAKNEEEKAPLHFYVWNPNHQNPKIMGIKSA